MNIKSVHTVNPGNIGGDLFGNLAVANETIILIFVKIAYNDIYAMT